MEEMFPIQLQVENLDIEQMHNMHILWGGLFLLIHVGGKDEKVHQNVTSHFR